MNQTVRTSALLAPFNRELEETLARVARFTGSGTISLQIDEPVFARRRAAARCSFDYEVEFHTAEHPGHVAFEGAPRVHAGDAAGLSENLAGDALERATAEAAVKQDIANGWLRETSRVVSDEIAAVTSFTCTACRNGETTCHGCNGRGETTCRNCWISGQPLGRLTCWNCHGMKGWNDAGSGQWSNCSVCNGWGHLACSQCDGSTIVRCATCRGHGALTCRSCQGHGCFTQTHSVRVHASSSMRMLESGLTDSGTRHVERWIKDGMLQRATGDADTLLPRSDLESARVTYGARKGGALRVDVELECSIATADFQARRNAKPFEVSYVRLDEPVFTFPTFLDGDFASLSKRASAAAGAGPAGVLGALEDAPGVADILRLETAGESDWERAIDDIHAAVLGSVSPPAVREAVETYAQSLQGFRATALKKAILTALAIFAGLWLAGLMSGTFDLLLHRRAPAQTVIALMLAAAAGFAFHKLVAGLACRRVRAETGAAAPPHAPWWEKAFAGAVGLAFAFAAALFA